MAIRREIQDLQDGPAGMTVEADSKRQIVETAKVLVMPAKPAKSQMTVWQI